MTCIELAVDAVMNAIGESQARKRKTTFGIGSYPTASQQPAAVQEIPQRHPIGAVRLLNQIMAAFCERSHSPSGHSRVNMLAFPGSPGQWSVMPWRQRDSPRYRLVVGKIAHGLELYISVWVGVRRWDLAAMLPSSRVSVTLFG